MKKLKKKIKQVSNWLLKKWTTGFALYWFVSLGIYIGVTLPETHKAEYLKTILASNPEWIAICIFIWTTIALLFIYRSGKR